LTVRLISLHCYLKNRIFEKAFATSLDCSFCNVSNAGFATSLMQYFQLLCLAQLNDCLLKCGLENLKYLDQTKYQEDAFKIFSITQSFSLKLFSDLNQRLYYKKRHKVKFENML